MSKSEIDGTPKRLSVCKIMKPNSTGVWLGPRSTASATDFQHQGLCRPSKDRVREAARPCPWAPLLLDPAFPWLRQQPSNRAVFTALSERADTFARDAEILEFGQGARREPSHSHDAPRRRRHGCDRGAHGPEPDCRGLRPGRPRKLSASRRHCGILSSRCLRIDDRLPLGFHTHGLSRRAMDQGRLKLRGRVDDDHPALQISQRTPSRPVAAA